MGKLEGRRPTERPRCRCEDNIKMGFGEGGLGHGLDRSASEQGQVAGSCVYGDKPSVSIKCGQFLE
jgi:hypothetical protein